MKIKQIEYKGFKIDVDYSDHMGDTFSCNTAHLTSSHFKGHINGGHPTIESAVTSIKLQIDTFLDNTPKNWVELTKALENSLIWTGYEDCELDTTLVKIIVENFISHQNK